MAPVLRGRPDAPTVAGDSPSLRDASPLCPEAGPLQSAVGELRPKEAPGDDMRRGEARANSPPGAAATVPAGDRGRRSEVGVEEEDADGEERHALSIQLPPTAPPPSS